MEQQIDFMASSGMPEIVSWVQIPVQMVLEHFIDDEIFKQGAFCKMAVYILGTAQVEQRACQAGIVKVQLWRLDDPLVEGWMIRPQQM